MASRQAPSLAPEAFGLPATLMTWRVVQRCQAYEISEYGHLRRAVAWRHHPAGKLVIPTLHPRGYWRYDMWVKGKAVKSYAHLLVALAFLGEPPSSKHEVAHNDGIPWHNHYTNLRWDTAKGNYSDRYIHGTHQHGERNQCARLTFEDVIRIRERALFGARTNDTARLFQVHHATVTNVVMRRTWVTG